MTRPALRHPGRWIWLPLLVLIVIGLLRLRFDAEVFDLLPADLPVVEGLKLYQQHFANPRELILTLQGSDPDQVESAARRIAEGLRPFTNLVASAVWEPPWLEHPDEAAELVAYLWFNQPPDAFKALLHRFAAEQLAEEFTSARRELATALSPEQIGRLSYDPLGLTQLPGSAAGVAPSFGGGEQLFSSPRGAFRLVYVRARPELNSYRDCDNWLGRIRPVVRAALAEQEGRPASSVTIGYTGRPTFVSEVAAGMKHDITTSVAGTAAVIALLFWLAHRRVVPMLWLLTLLAIILCSTLALGGLIYGTINVISTGFAAILLGLAVDYAVVHYQEALAHPGLSVPQIRHAIAPSIFWAATTTISAFLLLHLGGLPGLGQLGTLVGLGVALAACIMIFEYLPPLFPDRKEPGGAEAPLAEGARPADGAADRNVRAPGTRRMRPALIFTAALVAFSSVVLACLGLPRVDPTADALRPQHSPAYAALDQIENQLGQARRPAWLIVSGDTVGAVAERLRELQPALSQAVSNHLIESFTLSTPLWPRPEFQEANRPTARELGNAGALVGQVARTNGFAPRSLVLTERMLATWREAGASQGVFWPTNPVSRWVLDKVVARAPKSYVTIGLVDAGTNLAGLSTLAAELRPRGLRLSGWQLLGNAIFTRVRANMWRMIAPMLLLVLLSLWLAFRRMAEVALGVAVLLLSGLCLLAVMRAAGWAWNLLDMMSVPLVLGTGVDYSLFTLLALHRYHGDLAVAYKSVGRALLLCGGTAVAAFASLIWSSNAGMASLGEVCAVGIGFNMLIAVFLLPTWWWKLVGVRQYSK